MLGAIACDCYEGTASWTPSPRLRGEGRGEGASPRTQKLRIVERPPHPALRADLSPQAGRGGECLTALPLDGPCANAAGACVKNVLRRVWVPAFAGTTGGGDFCASCGGARVGVWAATLRARSGRSGSRSRPACRRRAP